MSYAEIVELANMPSVLCLIFMVSFMLCWGILGVYHWLKGMF